VPAGREQTTRQQDAPGAQKRAQCLKEGEGRVALANPKKQKKKQDRGPATSLKQVRESEFAMCSPAVPTTGSSVAEVTGLGGR
jgi:hypothetical protein